MKKMLNDPYQVVYKYGGLSLYDYIMERDSTNIDESHYRKN